MVGLGHFWAKSHLPSGNTASSWNKNFNQNRISVL